MIVRSLVLITNVLRIILAKYNTVFCNVRYGTVHVQFYGTSKCMCPTRDDDCDFYEILFLLQSSLACTIARG